LTDVDTLDDRSAVGITVSYFCDSVHCGAQDQCRRL